jgi:hypothetical protein
VFPSSGVSGLIGMMVIFVGRQDARIEEGIPRVARDDGFILFANDAERAGTLKYLSRAKRRVER